jgi:hypothetical protein
MTSYHMQTVHRNITSYHNTMSWHRQPSGYSSRRLGRLSTFAVTGCIPCIPRNIAIQAYTAFVTSAVTTRQHCDMPRVLKYIWCGYRMYACAYRTSRAACLCIGAYRNIMIHMLTVDMLLLLFPLLLYQLPK